MLAAALFQPRHRDKMIDYMLSEQELSKDNKDHEDHSSSERLSMKGLIKEILGSPEFSAMKTRLNLQEEIVKTPIFQAHCPKDKSKS